MGFEDIGRNTAVQVQQQGYQQAYDPAGQAMIQRPTTPMERYQDSQGFADPWGSGGGRSLSEKVVEKIFSVGIKRPEDFENVDLMLLAIVDSFGRIPTADTPKIKSLWLDYTDLLEFRECQGTESMVKEMAMELLAETRLLCSDASGTGKGLTAVSSVITNINRSEQQIRMPTDDQPQVRKKIFGIF